MTQTRFDPALSMRQRAALIATKALLESGQLVHISEEEITEPSDDRFFNMNFWNDDQSLWTDEEDPDTGATCEVQRHCGTFMCIGGTAEWILGGRFVSPTGETSLSDLTDFDKRLYELFYPGQNSNKSIDWNRITPAAAAKAIQNYLDGKAVAEIWEGYDG